MNFEFILLIVVFVYMRKTLQSKILLPEINTYLLIGFWLSIVLLFTQTILNSAGKSIIGWIANVALIGIIYMCLTREVYKPVKPFIYSILPYAIVNFIKDATELISTTFHDKWKDYFETAIVFSVIWFFAMFFINKKQRNDIEKEQLKAVEREKEFQQSEALKAKLEIQVAERTAELLGQKEELQMALDELKATQNQLIQSEKMASLGELTAGIAHEIQNPLNFVNNFSEVSTELIEELKSEKAKDKSERDEALEDEILNDIRQNLEKINFHGKRADAIVKGMLQHSRTSSGIKEPTDINALADEYLRLAYHGLRAKHKSLSDGQSGFNADFKTEFDETLPKINVIPQDIGRVILNLITNAFYAVDKKAKDLLTAPSEKGIKEKVSDYKPTVIVRTSIFNPPAAGSRGVLISVADNGHGIPSEIKDKIFQPFFTTKPSGQGTGLGLSLSYDIVKAHGGELKVETNENEGATFTIMLPI